MVLTIGSNSNLCIVLSTDTLGLNHHDKEKVFSYVCLSSCVGCRSRYVQGMVIHCETGKKCLATFVLVAALAVVQGMFRVWSYIVKHGGCIRITQLLKLESTKIQNIILSLGMNMRYFITTKLLMNIHGDFIYCHSSPRTN